VTTSLAREFRSVAHTAKAFTRLYRPRMWEPEAHMLPFLLQPTDVCWQVGASDGQYTYILAKAVPDGEVIAFEPSTFTYRIMERLVRLTGLTNVNMQKKAVSDAPGELQLTVPVKRSGRLGHSFSFVTKTDESDENISAMMAGKTQYESEVVEAVTLDGFAVATGITRCDFLRCDVEGAEALVLAGAKDMIAREKPTVMIEIHTAFIQRRFGMTAESVRDSLLERGYVMFHMGPGNTAVQSNELVHDKFGDYFFCHPSRAGHLPAGPFKDALGG